MSLRKARAGRAQPVDLRGQVADLELEAVPSAGLWAAPVGQDLPAAAASAGHAEQQAQVAAGEHGEGRRGVHDHLEAEVIAIEADRRVEVVDDVPDAHWAHGFPPRGWVRPKS